MRGQKDRLAVVVLVSMQCDAVQNTDTDRQRTARIQGGEFEELKLGRQEQDLNHLVDATRSYILLSSIGQRLFHFCMRMSVPRISFANYVS